MREEIRRLWWNSKRNKKTCNCGYKIQPGWNWCGNKKCKIMQALEDFNREIEVYKKKN